MGIINLELNQLTGGEITIYDQLGRALIHRELYEINTSIDLSDYDNGVYFFRLVLEDDEVHTGKIVIE